MGEVIFSKVSSYSNILDSTKYYEVIALLITVPKAKGGFSLSFKNEDVQKYPLDVEFKHKSTFFDLESIG